MIKVFILVNDSVKYEWLATSFIYLFGGKTKCIEPKMIKFSPVKKCFGIVTEL